MDSELEERCQDSSQKQTSTSETIMPQDGAALALKERASETLEVIKEDLCQWLSKVLKTNITPATFLDCLDTGILLCKLAKLVQEASRVTKKPKVQIPSEVVKCNDRAVKKSFLARDNTSNFISWCRHLGVEEAVIFESEGLVLHKDEKRVVLCLLDVARFAEGVGIHPPQLVRMEREIETLEKTKSPQPRRKLKGSEKTLEERVMLQLRECTCTHLTSTNPFSARTCGNGKFVIHGGNIRGDKTLYARLLSDRIMVRVGGGWVTLEHFLLEHDPCRVKNLFSDHVTVTLGNNSSQLHSAPIDNIIHH